MKSESSFICYPASSPAVEMIISASFESIMSYWAGFSFGNRMSHSDVFARHPCNNVGPLGQVRRYIQVLVECQIWGQI